MTETGIEVEGLSKSYRLYEHPSHRLLEILLRRPRHRSFMALDGVSFAVPRGEAMGLVGENGAGKSTLLKILAGITAPSGGSFRVSGKVAAILELGSGFHPEFTGRQNAVLNAALLGLSEEQVHATLPHILEFSELGDFIDQPVKTYSTGMAMRLAFSIATQVEPDVLIIDEALSVGDGYFQKKCLDRLQRFLSAGGTLLFCSHAMYYVAAFCQRALWLRNGHVAALGPTDSVIREYESFLLAKNKAAAEGEGDQPVRELESPAPARLEEVRLVGGHQSPGEGSGQSARIFRQGEPLAVEVEWATENPELGFHLGVGINRIDEVEVAVFGTLQDGLPPLSGRRSYRATVHVPRLPLIKGDFTIYVFLLDEAGLHIHDRRVVRGAFRVQAEGYWFGLIAAEHHWKIEEETVSASEVDDRRPLAAEG